MIPFIIQIYSPPCCPLDWIHHFYWGALKECSPEYLIPCLKLCLLLTDLIKLVNHSLTLTGKKKALTSFLLDCTDSFSLQDWEESLSNLSKTKTNPSCPYSSFQQLWQPRQETHFNRFSQALFCPDWFSEWSLFYSSESEWFGPF